jgi:hypothetical protein
MNITGFKKKFYKINNRAKITILPISEYSKIKGYELTLKYKIKNKLFNKYIWVSVNTVRINEKIDINSTDFKSNLKYLLMRRKEDSIKYKNDIYLLKKQIKQIYYERI